MHKYSVLRIQWPFICKIRWHRFSYKGYPLFWLKSIEVTPIYFSVDLVTSTNHTLNHWPLDVAISHLWGISASCLRHFFHLPSLASILSYFSHLINNSLCDIVIFYQSMHCIMQYWLIDQYPKTCVSWKIQDFTTDNSLHGILDKCSTHTFYVADVLLGWEETEILLKAE